MQSENRLLEDLARLAGGAFSSFTTLKDEAEARVHEKLENILGRMDLVKRDEFDAVKAMAIKARTENAALGEHILRAKANWSADVPADACTETTYGETEDYMVNIVEPLGINDVELADLRIYPNPVDGNYVTIKSPIGGDKQIELFDINGRRVLSTIITGDTLDISSINTGFYMVEVTINGYKKVSKLIIE